MSSGPLPCGVPFLRGRRGGVTKTIVFVAAMAAAVPPASGAPGAHVGGVEEAVAGRMIARVNHHRTLAGLAPLSPDARLSRAAGEHARAMAEHDFFAHQRNEGDSFSARASAAGYRWRLVAENIAAGLSSPEDTVDGWMDSEGHRRNILDTRLRHAGVGYALIDPDPGRVRYRHYWVLKLGAPAEPSPR